MDVKQAKFMGDMQKKAPLDYFKFIDSFRKLYNILCRDCQGKTIRAKGQLKLNDYCDKCREKAKPYIESASDIIIKHGGKIEVK